MSALFRKCLIVLALSGASASVGCPGCPPRITVDDLRASQEALASNAAGLALYRELAAGEGNLGLSPVGVRAALGLASLGARGQTRAQLEQALQLGDDVAGDASALHQALTARDDVTVRIASRAWPQAGFPLEPGYVEALAPYAVGIEPLDFARDPEAGREAINAWVADRTRDEGGEPMIPELLRTLSPLTRFVLTNAVVFQGRWAEAFDPEQTCPAPFRRHDGSTVEVALMHQPLASLRLVELPSGAQAAALSYRAGGAELIVVLPAENTAAALRAAEAELGTVAEALAGAPEQDCALAFPRLRVDVQLGLEPALAALGVTDVFDPRRADLRGIAASPAGQNALHVSQVVHQVVVAFDEQGTEAAAATGVVMVLEAAPVVTAFRVDRPFLYLLRDTATGAILFLGRVVDPGGPSR